MLPCSRLSGASRFIPHINTRLRGGDACCGGRVRFFVKLWRFRASNRAQRSKTFFNCWHSFCALALRCSLVIAYGVQTAGDALFGYLLLSCDRFAGVGATALSIVARVSGTGAFGGGPGETICRRRQASLYLAAS